MDPNFDYNLMPYDFVHCLNAECLRADTCLRHQMALRIPADRKTVTIVTPSSIKPSGEDCPHFKADKMVDYARGITHLLDQLPYNKSVVIKKQLLNHFGRSLYYRFWRKEHLISPSQQEDFRYIFQKNGIKEEPVFDEFIPHYE